MARSSRNFTEQEKANALATLSINGGNATKTARDLAMSKSTLLAWRDKQAKNPSQAIEAAIEQETDQFVVRATAARDAALTQVMVTIKNTKSAREAATVVGILDDKIRLAKGLSTQNVQSSPTEDPAALQKMFGGWLDELIESAHRRSAEVQAIADVIEAEEIKELPSGIDN